MKKIVYCGGFWSTNIGNAFYDLGILHALGRARPDDEISFLSDVPEYFWGGSENRFNLLDRVECDVVIFSGPVFSVEFEKTVGRHWRRLHRSGIAIWLLSVGAYRFDETEKSVCRNLLEECPPEILVSRDQETFETYGDLARSAHSGICFAFFCPDYFKPLLFKGLRDVIAVNFDNGYDYDVLVKYENELAGFLEGDRPFTSGAVPLKRSRMASRLAAFRGFEIVRTCHVANPSFKRQVGQFWVGAWPGFKQGVYMSDVPYDYLNIYAQTRLTISERVHACVPTLAYGRPAWLISRTKRARLFDRVGCPDIRQGPVRLDLDALAKEKERLVGFIEETL